MVHIAVQICNALIKYVACIVFAFALSLVLVGSLIAQENIDYRGAWQTETSEGDSLVLIIKRNNLASYFWSENDDITVHQGSWDEDGNGVTLKWNDGSSHKIEQDLLTYKVTHFDPSQNETYTAKAEKLPEEILGQWAKSPSDSNAEDSNRERTKGFFGTWKAEGSSSPYFVIIEPDRSAATNWSENDAREQNLRGSWVKQGSELHIVWDTGHYSILKQKSPETTFQILQPDTIIEKAEIEPTQITRIDENTTSDEWLNLYADEKAQKPSGSIFKDRKGAAAFYRGSWIVKHSENVYEQIDIGRFGGLKTSADSKLYGDWRMSGKDIFMNWDDGMRRILRSIGNGFVLYEYKPGRPIDGVPTKIFPATPKDESKLTEYIGKRKKAAVELFSLAKRSGALPDVASARWDKALLQWTRPSNTNSSNQLPQINGDPWWWPLWSENAIDEAPVDKSQRSTVEIAVNSKKVETTTISEEETNETLKQSLTNRSAKSNWEWPFN